MKKNVLLVPLFIMLLVSCEQLIGGMNTEVKKPVYVITHGKFTGGVIKKTPEKKEYNRNETVIINAYEDAGYKFTGWKGVTESKDKQLSLVMNSNIDITPVFTAIPTFKIGIEKTEGGEIRISPEKEYYLENDEVTIKAIVKDGWYFQGWNNIGFGSDAQIEVTVNKDYLIAPVFKKIPKYRIDIQKYEGGQIHISPNKKEYDQNEKVTITAICNEGYRFSGIKGTVILSDLISSISMDKNYELVPIFVKNPKYTIHMQEAEGFSIHIDPDKSEYQENEKVTLTALPIDGYSFVQWEGTALRNENVITLVMNRDYIQKPIYRKNEHYMLSITNNTGGKYFVDPLKESYEKNEIVTITALPDESYFFNGWQGSMIDSSRTLELTMNKNYTLIPQFSQKKVYSLVVEKSDFGDVYIDPVKEWYDEDEVVLLAAIPSSKCHFVGWQGSRVSPDMSISIVMNKNYIQKPVFAGDQTYTLEIQKSDYGIVSIDPIKENYAENEAVTLTAIPSDNYSFAGWQGTRISPEPSITIQMTKNYSQIPQFIRNKEYTLVIEKSEFGEVFIDPLKESYAENETVTLTAIPADNCSFAGWQGTRISPEPSITIQMTKNYSQIPQFIRNKEYTLVIEKSEFGEVFIDPMKESYAENEAVTLTAIPSDNYTFAGWQGTRISPDKTITISMNKNYVQNPVFILNKTFLLTISVSSKGTVLIDPVKESYEENEAVTLTAIPSDNCSFAGWQGTRISPDKTITISMNKNYVQNPVFILNKTFLLTIPASNKGTVLIDPVKESYEEGESVTLTAIPSDNYSFAGWQGTKISPDKTIAITMNKNYVQNPVFILNKTFLLTIPASNKGTVLIDPVKESYEEGESVTLTAIPSDNYSFAGWQGTRISPDRTITIIMNKNYTENPVFALNETFTITIQASDKGTVLINPMKESYQANEVVTVCAIPSDNCNFDGWEGTIESPDKTINLTMNSNYTLLPQFNEHKAYILEIQQSDYGTIFIDPLKETYAENEVVTLTAIPSDNCSFAGWQGTRVSQDSAIILHMTKNYVQIPQFVQNKTYSLVVENSDFGEIYIDPIKETYAENETVCVTAVPLKGYHFGGWQGSRVSAEESIQIVMTKNYTQKPVFVRNTTYTITIPASEKGSVLIDPLKESYEQGESVTLTAIPSEQYNFAGWQGTRISSESTITLSMISNYTQNPVFTMNKTYIVSIPESDKGTVVIDPMKESYEENEIVTITAIPLSNCYFTGWEGTKFSPDKTITITMNKNYTLLPQFFEIITYRIELQKTDYGEVYIDPLKETYAENETVVLTAIPHENCSFKGWQGTRVSQEGTLSLIMSKNYNQKAVFAINPTYTIDIENTDKGTVIIDPLKDSYEEGETVTLNAIPSDNCSFAGWQGTRISDEKTITLCMTKNYIQTPIFIEKVKYSLEIEQSLLGAVYINPDKLYYDENESVTITAVPNENSIFNGWQGTYVSSDKTINIVMNRNYVQKPMYSEKKTYSITLNETDNGNIYIDPLKELYDENEIVLITAEPNTDFIFSGWNGTVTSSDSTIQVKMNKNYIQNALFTPVVKYSLELKKSAGGRIVCAPDKELFYESETAYLNAVPEDGYLFSYWKGDITGTDNTYALSMLRNYSVEAVFEKIPEVVKYYMNEPSIYGNGELIISPLKEYYLENETITIKAVPESDYIAADMSCSSQDYVYDSNKQEMLIQVQSDVYVDVHFIKREWTFIIYMAADNDLESAAIQDFNELEAVDYNGKPVSIVVLLDRSPLYDGTNGNWSGTKLYEIQKDYNGLDGVIRSKQLTCSLLDLDPSYTTNLNTGSKDVLQKLLQYTQSAYTAENYGLIMWGHGTGWRSSNAGSSTGVKAFAVDDTEQTWMNNSELGKAIDGKNIDIIGFDTCFGGVLETAYEMKDYAQIMIGSEGSVPSGGWDYSSLFSSFINDDLSNNNFCTQVVDQYKNQYSMETRATISVIDLSYIQQVKNAFDAFSQQAANLVISEGNRTSFLDCIVEETENYHHNTTNCDFFVDIYSLTKNLSRLYPSLGPSSQITQTALEDAVINSWCSFPSDGFNLGVFFHTLDVIGKFTNRYSAEYVQGSGVLRQSKFVLESNGWVPTESETKSLLDKLFFVTF